MLKRFGKFIFVFTVITGWLFSGWSNVSEFSSLVPLADAAIGDIGHWRDTTGSQIPGTTFAAFNFNSEIQNDGIYTKPSSAILELDEAGDYLIIATMAYADSSNGRFGPQSKVALTSGTGTVFTSHYSGYSRNNVENDAWTRAVGIVIGASADAQIQIQTRRDADTPTGGSTISASDVQVVRINPTNYGLYAIGGGSVALGGTTPNTVDITAVSSESDTAAIEGNTTSETVTVKGDNKRYLVAWSVSGITAGSRTQRIGHLEYDGVDDLATLSYCYQRNAANEYCGLGSMDIIETATADIAIQTEVFRGSGILADEGGADIDGSFSTDNNGQMVVLELPDSLEVFRSHDSTGLQDLTSTSAVNMNIMRDVDFNDAASFTKASNTAMDVTNPADIFSWANIWSARNVVSSAVRFTGIGSVTVNAVEQSTGKHGNYVRGNQSTTDSFAASYHPAGIFTVGTAGHDIGINMQRNTGGGAGGTDRSQANTAGFFSLNLDTLLPPAFEQSAYRWFNNANSTDVGSALAVQDTSATLASSGDAFRLRTLLHLSDAQMRLSEENFKLQFATKSGTCDIGFSGETYADVTAATAIAYNNNATPADGDNLTANASDPTHSGHSIVNQDYEELNNFTNTVAAIPTGQDGKWDFALIDNSAPASTSYCFRLRKSDGSALDTYTVIPEITTASAGGTTTIGDEFDPADSTVAPGSAITDLDSFIFSTSSGIDSITALTVTLGPAGAFNNIGEVRITNSAGSTTYFSAVANPVSNTVNFSGGTPIPVTTSVTTFKVRITPKTHANMPAVPGASYATTGTITAFTSTNSQAGTDTDSAIITIDNTSPGGVTATSGTIGDTQVQLDWTNPVDADFTTGGEIVVLRRAVFAVADVPVEGTSYIVGNIIGTATVACVLTGSPPAETCTDTGLTNGTVYHYEIFTKDSRGNHDAGVVPVGSPFTPLSPTYTQSAYRLFENDNSTDVGAALAAQDTSANLTSTGEDFRLRMLMHVDTLSLLTANAQNFKLQFATKSGTCDTGFSGETYADVTAATAIAYNNNATPADGDNLTANASDPTHSGHTIVNQDYEELNNFTNTVADIPVGQDGMWDFSLSDNGAPEGTSYCLRTVKSDGSVLDTYDVIPEITTKIIQTLSFSISDNAIGFGSLSPFLSTYASGLGSGSSSPITAHTISASTNAGSGYVITVDGSTLECTGCSGSPTIDAIGASAAAANPGTEQFGFRAIVDSGTGSVSSPYNITSYAFDSASVPDIVMTGLGDEITTVFNLEYLANITEITEAGEYETSLTYTITPTF